MVAERGLHPYRDFPYFHMPNMVYLYAPFFLLTEYPLLAARLFVGLCGMGICLVLFQVARTLFWGRSQVNSLVLALSSMILLVHSQLFAVATSHIWNHTPPTLCALLAFLVHCRALRSCSREYFFLSGILLGMAIGIRLSFAPLVFPFLVTLFVFPPCDLRSKTLAGLAFALGGLIANAPSIYFMLTCGPDFIFGNLSYATLNTLYRSQTNWAAAMTLAGKIRFFKDVVFDNPADLLIVVVSVYSLALLGIGKAREAVRTRLEVPFLLLCLPFLFAGSLAPTPSWYVYFFAPMPFILMLALYSLASLANEADLRSASILLVSAHLFLWPIVALLPKWGF